MGFKRDGDKTSGENNGQNRAPSNPIAEMRRHKEQLKSGQQQPTHDTASVAQPEEVVVKPTSRPENKTERARSEQPSNKGNSFMTGNNFFDMTSPLISNASSGQELGKLLEIGRKWLEEDRQRLSQGGKLDWNLIPVPGGQVNYLVDSVVVTATVNIEGVSVTAATALMLMSKGRLPDQIEKDGGLQYQYSSVPSDIFTESYQAGVAQQIRNTIGNKAGDISLLGAVTVPNTFRYEEGSIRDMLLHIMNDLYFGFADMLVDPNNRTFDINQIIKEDEEVAGRVVLSPGDDHDVFGAPRRRDISMTITKQQKRNSNSVNAVEGARMSTLAQIDAYGDYLWLGRKQESRSRRRTRRDEAEMDIYALGLNVTLLSSGDRQVTEMQLLALSGISALVQEDIITQSMLPAGETQHLRQAEAVAVEQDKEFGEVPKNPSKDEWIELNEAVVREDSLHVFLHIEENGVLGRVQNQFLAAASGDKAAQQELYDAAYRLTNGSITDFFGDDLQFGKKEDRIILLGYFVDEKGQTRDLREIDRFFIMSAYGLKGDTKVLELWDNACHNSQYPLAARLSKMEEIIKGCVAQVTITGHATPVHVNPEWLFGLTDAVREAGLSIPTEGLSVDSTRHQAFSSSWGRGGYDGSTFRGRGTRGSYGFDRR